MAERNIRRHKWAEALEQFSWRHRGWLASVAGGPLAPLVSVELEGDTIVVRRRDAPEFRIDGVNALRIGAMGLDVETARGLIGVQFRSSATPEELDGLAPAER